MIKTNMCISKNVLPFGKAWLGFLLLPFMVGCSGDDLEQYAQRSDNANEIGFMTRTENVTRGYSMENPHPATMGVLGYHDLSELHMKDNEFIIFNNKKVSYEDDAWIYSPIKFWPEYASFNNFDFFGYMPYSSNATLTYYDLGYTLSFNTTLSVPTIKEGKDLPLICDMPHHKDAPGEIVKFAMDQTTTGFQLKFKLGTKMSNVREFEITKVEVLGQIPNKGKISRTYTCNEDGTWKANQNPPIVWSNVTTTEMALDILNEKGSLRLFDDEFHEWGNPFFVIPVESFAPTIRVTYNVKVADNGTVTRENVMKTIVFNKDNFANLKKQGLMPGKINSLEIAIVPDHLYILADADQYIGYLVME